MITEQSDTGMELRDLLNDSDFPMRRERKHDASDQLQAFRKIAQVFADDPDSVLQELVDAAVVHCGAESAGISLEETGPDGNLRFRWIAVAGSFSRFLNGTTPRFFSPCGTTLNARRPQLYRVTQPYYEFLGIEAEPINDGILIPWETGEIRGTVWAVSHGSRETFDIHDYNLLNSIADFAAVAIRHQAQQKAIRAQQELRALQTAVNRLAHDINNPLQSLTNTLYLASASDGQSKEYLRQANGQLQRITNLVSRVLGTRTVSNRAA